MSLTTPIRHALPVNESLFHKPLYLTHAGWERVQPGDPYPQSDAPMYAFKWNEGRVLPEFCLCMNIDGLGEYQTRRRHGLIQTGDVFFLRPDEWHRHRPLPSIGWTIMWIHFNGSLPHQWLLEDAFNLRQNIVVLENRSLFQAQFEHLLLTVDRNPSKNSTTLSLQALGLLSHFVRDTSGGAAAGAEEIEDELVKAAVEFVWNFSHGIVDVPAVARKVGIARRTLDRRFKTATARSVLEEIQRCRVSRAAKLLEETHVPIKQVAHRAGFRGAEHLRLTFQKVFGKSPKAYRKMARD